MFHIYCECNHPPTHTYARTSESNIFEVGPNGDASHSPVVPISGSDVAAAGSNAAAESLAHEREMNAVSRQNQALKVHIERVEARLRAEIVQKDHAITTKDVEILTLRQELELKRIDDVRTRKTILQLYDLLAARGVTNEETK